MLATSQLAENLRAMLYDTFYAITSYGIVRDNFIDLGRTTAENTVYDDAAYAAALRVARDRAQALADGLAPQMAAEMETWVKTGTVNTDVNTTVPTGTFSQGAGAAATPNPMPVPLSGDGVGSIS